MAKKKAVKKKQAKKKPVKKAKSKTSATSFKERSNEEIYNQIRCAEINLDNLALQMPQVKDSMFFKVVKMQLSEALGKDSIDADPDQHELPLPLAGAIPT